MEGSFSLTDKGGQWFRLRGKRSRYVRFDSRVLYETVQVGGLETDLRRDTDLKKGEKDIPFVEQVRTFKPTNVQQKTSGKDTRGLNNQNRNKFYLT